MRPEAYLDHHATTPVDRRVLDGMWPYFAEHYGNPANGSNAAGREAHRAVERAREQIATLIGARSDEITFTGGGTESNNLALKGVVRAGGANSAPHIITVVTEHPSVLETCRALTREGCRVTELPVGSDGLIDLDDLRDALRTPTRLVSIMTANNEIGVLQPMAEIGAIAHAAGALLHTDAAQAAGKVPLDVRAMNVDLLSMTAHKMYGPMGIGALYAPPDVGRLEPVVHGGGQERGVRSGTLNVPGIVGFGIAAAVAMAEIDDEATRIAGLRGELLAGLLEHIPDLRVNGSMTARLPHNLNVSVPGVDAGMLRPVLDDLGVSTGSACSSAHTAPSHVLSALGVPDDLARASIRFGLGRWTTTATIEHAITHVSDAVRELRRSEVQSHR
jgi:cysteine desulfurase